LESLGRGRSRGEADSTGVASVLGIGEVTAEMASAARELLADLQSARLRPRVLFPDARVTGPVSALFGSDIGAAAPSLAGFGLSPREIWTKSPAELDGSLRYRVWAASRIHAGDTLLRFEMPFRDLAFSEASILAFALCRSIRKARIPALFAAAPVDLHPYLDVDCRFSERAGNVASLPWNPGTDPEALVMERIRIGTGSVADYLALAGLHYAPVPEGIGSVYVARCGDSVAAATVFRSPMHELDPEVVAASPVLRCLDARVVNEARSVVHPSFRGLDLRMRLVRRAMADSPGRLFETRTSLFKGSRTMLKHGTPVARPYRAVVPAYHERSEYCRSAGLGFPDRPEGEAARPEAAADPDGGRLRRLVLARLREIDTHQWMYFESLAARLDRFDASECRLAGESYLESLGRGYQGRPTMALLELCRNWDSEAYVFNAPDEARAQSRPDEIHQPGYARRII